ncbi:hypothetical protein [Enterococcus sp. N249-2]
MFTMDMFEPIITATTQFVPIGLGVGVACFAVTGVATKGFNFIKSMFF